VVAKTNFTTEIVLIILNRTFYLTENKTGICWMRFPGSGAVFLPNPPEIRQHEFFFFVKGLHNLGMDLICFVQTKVLLI